MGRMQRFGKLRRFLILLPAILMLAAASRHVLAWALCPSPQADLAAVGMDAGHDCCKTDKNKPGSGHECCKIQQATTPASASIHLLNADADAVEAPVISIPCDDESEESSQAVLGRSDSSPPKLCPAPCTGRAPPAAV